MKVLKICIGTWVNASRDKRELSVVQELGHEVEVIAKGDVSGQIDMVDGFKVTRLSSRPLGENVPVTLNRMLSMFTWAAYIRKRNDIDVISGHDYLALTIGWMSNVGKRKKAKLVYDSHEFELGRNTKRSKLAYWTVCHWERFLMKRCAFSIMVNDVIADEVQRIHKLKERPIVVRSTPPYWELDEKSIQETRKMLCAKMGVPENNFLLMYHGQVTNDRGIEQLFQVLSHVSNCACVILGNADSEQYVKSLYELATSLGIADRVLFHPAVSMQVLRNYVGAADVGTIVAPSNFKSYYYSLPNKFFENIQSETPVVVSDFPEMGRIIDMYQIGLKIDPDNLQEIAGAICRMRDDKAFYQSCKENIKKAKTDLCWENEKKALQEAYRRIFK